MSDLSQTNLKFGKKFFHALFEGDWSYLAANITEDFTVHEAEGMPYKGEYKGITGFQSLLAEMTNTYFDNLDFKLLDMAASEERLMAHWRISGKVKSNGKPIDVEIAEITFLKNGKVDKIKPFYWDTKAISEAFSE